MNTPAKLFILPLLFSSENIQTPGLYRLINRLTPAEEKNQLSVILPLAEQQPKSLTDISARLLFFS